MRLRTTALAFALALLGACGGGGGGGDGGGGQRAQPQTTFSGTVAGDVALAGYTIDILAPTGPNQALSARATTGPDGRYSATSFLGTVPPFVISAIRFQDAEPQYLRLYSIAHRGGTANVTPLTSLLVARLLNRKPEAGVDIRAAFELQQTRSEADVRAARDQVVAYLLNRSSPVDVSAVADFVSMPLGAVPGDPHFEALKRLDDSLMDSETIDGVEEHMLFGNDAPADLRAMLALDFLANCTVQGVDDPSLPRGSTRIILDQRAVTLGSVDLAFQTGDRLGVEAGLTAEDRWVFAFTASQRSVEFSIREGRLISVLLTIPTSSSRCVPQSEVPLSGKHPSLIALIRLLALSITDLGFQCAGPITFTGFQTGANLMSVEPNGALRVNGPGGPSLHLPSLNIVLSTRLTVSGGQLSPIRATSFLAGRGLRGGFDEFTVRLSDAGLITGLRLARQNEQSSRTQSCGVI